MIKKIVRVIMRDFLLRKAIVFLFLLHTFCHNNLSAIDFDNHYNHSYGNEITYFSILGERCSGTNFLSRLIENNCTEIKEVHCFGHKHFPCWFEFPINPSLMKTLGYPSDYYSLKNSDDCLFLVILRDPYDWIRSFYAVPWHVPDEIKNYGFSHFIRSKWKAKEKVSLGDNINPYTKAPFKNALELRKYKTINYLAMGKKVKNFCLVRYEDLEKDPKGFLEYLSRKYNLALSQGYHPIDTYKGSNIPYVKKQYPLISPNNLIYINQNLDWELESLFNYIQYNDPYQIQNR